MSHDTYDYRPEMVLDLLPQAYDPYATPKTDADELQRGGGDPATGGNNLAHLADVRRFLSHPAFTAGSALYWHAHGEPSTMGEQALTLLVDLINGK